MARRLRFLVSEPRVRTGRADLPAARLSPRNFDARIVLTAGHDSLRTCQIDIIYGETAGNEAVPSRSGGGSNRRRSVNEGREELDLILLSGALEEPAVVLLKD